MASFSLLVTLLFLLSTFPSSVHPKNACPLDFSVLRRLAPSGPQPSVDTRTECGYILLSLRLLFSDHLRRTGDFLPPPSAAESCWSGFQSLLSPRRRRFDIRSSCGFDTDWISRGCMNITTRAQFEALVPAAALADVASSCDQPLMNASPCASCTTALADLPALYLTGNSPANLSDCTAYPSIYAAAFSNRFGPADPGTATCLFNLNFPRPKPRTNRMSRAVVVTVVVTVAALSAAALAVAGGLWWARRRRRARRDAAAAERERGLGSVMDSINGGGSGNGGLVKYSFEEVKKATGNFSRHNMIGRGGYGNVYRGVLADGTEVALKRFKNCSAAGDAGFAHEVEVIASVRHVNLVALRGYCTATTPYEGHQRIIVCDLMANGSLHDHLSDELRRRKLSWPARRKIALGTARGVAYLHHGAQPAIIHRDIKANNILLDDSLEARVADFGLARFTPEEGMMASHVSTRVAGTMGYVAPEYALYGQLSERSDVYSFGVVLLELLSGKTALLDGPEGQPLLLTDWAWGLVREGRAQDVVEDNVPEKGPPDELERYVLVAVLCSHPQVMARPTMDQVVNMLETDLSLSLPSIPERPLPIVADIRDIERSMSSASSVSGTCQPSPRGPPS